MNIVTPAPLKIVTADLVRRGLPLDYAQRAAAELTDHHGDLVAELHAAGLDEAAASTEASRRLGDSRTLVEKTVREYRRRFWCARWPLITFLLGPIPVWVATYVATALVLAAIDMLLVKLGYIESSELHAAISQVPLAVKYAVLIWLFVALPTLVTYGFARLARRAALGWHWTVLVACILGLTAGSVKVERIGPNSRITMRDRQTLEKLPHPRQPDFAVMIPVGEWMSGTEWTRWYLGNPQQACQLLLPMAIAGGVLVRARQLALRRERLLLAGC